MVDQGGYNQGVVLVQGDTEEFGGGSGGRDEDGDRGVGAGADGRGFIG